MECFIEIATKCFLNDSNQNKIIALNFMVDIWLLFPSYIDENPNISENILSFLKKSTRDLQSNVLVNCSIIFLFKILDVLAINKNTYAPIIYKTLTFSCIENYSNISLREIFLKNFEEIFEKYLTIPIHILLEPLIKQIQVNEKNYAINIFDLEFFKKCAMHPKMQIKLAIIMFDLMIKVVYIYLCLNS